MDVIAGQGRVEPAESVANAWTVLDAAQSSPQRLPSILDVSRGGLMHLAHPVTALAVYEEALVCSRSDLIVLPREPDTLLVWEKWFLPNMAKTRPLDRNVTRFDRTLQSRVIDFWVPAKTARVATAVSLLGACAAHWGHFLAEYLSRLVLSMPHVAQEPVAVLLPAGLDQNCVDLVQVFLADYPDAYIAFVEEDESVLCDRLVLASKGTYLCDDSDYASPFDLVVRHWTPAALQRVIAKAREALEVPLAAKGGRRFYFPRKPGFRDLRNADEVEALMTDAGYESIDPSTLSLSEKLSLFGSASALAMVTSSALFNTLFLPAGTRVLCISPYVRAHDHLLSTMRPDVTFDVVAGIDETTNVHASFQIAPDRVREALAAFEA